MASSGRDAAPPRRFLPQLALHACRQFWQQLTLPELSGAMGDLGTLLPLLVGLVRNTGLDLGTTLIFTGMYNVATGAAFGLPMPVQPMKTIAAVALSQAPLTVPQIMAAGLFVSTCVLVLGATRMFGLATSLIPLPVVHGMQLGLGLQLAGKGWRLVWFADGRAAPVRQLLGPSGLLPGLLALAFVLLAVYPLPAQQQQQAGREEGPGQEQRLRQYEEGPACGGGEGRRPAEGGGGDPPGRRGAPLEVVVDPGGDSLGGGDAKRPPSSGSASPTGRQALLPRDGPSSGGRSGGGEAGSPLAGLQQRLLRLAGRAERGLGGEGGGPGAGASGGCRAPAALLVVVAGLLLTLAYHPEVASTLRFGPSAVHLALPSLEDWKTGVLHAGLPQLALTGLNSVIGVCQLAGHLFPDRPMSPDKVAFSVGAMNLLGCWFGAMPCCHGAGGLAAQARFGARSGAAPIFLGLCKLALGLLLGSSLLALLQAFPAPLLGALLLFAGLELAGCARGQGGGERSAALLLLTAAVTLAASNAGAGVLAGLAAAYSLLAWDWVWERAAPALRRAADP